MSLPRVKCIFCGDFIHERGVASHLRGYHHISSLFLPAGPSSNDAQTQIEPGDRDFIYGNKSGDGDLNNTPGGTLAVQSSFQKSEELYTSFMKDFKLF